MKKNYFSKISLILLALCFSIAAAGCEAKRTTWSRAYSLYEEGKYEEALAIFDTLENFRGSDSLADECREKIKMKNNENTVQSAEDKDSVIKEPADVIYDSSIEIPVFSKESGFYSDEFELELSLTGDGEIRYTTDGSIPSAESDLYTEAIDIKKISGYPNIIAGIKETAPEESQFAPSQSVDKATVIRAAVFRDGKSGPVITNTYFTGKSQKDDYNNLPVISLTTDAYNLFDYEKGIYVLGKSHDDWKNTSEAAGAEEWEVVGNYSQKGKEWERPVHMELIEPDGTAGFEQDLGIRIMGKASRTYTQKSFRLYAREEYGKKKIEYSLIPGLTTESDSSEELNVFKSFLLRNGGNDCSYVKLRDPFIQTVVSGMNFATQGSRPAVVFINGEFWGVYAIEEDYSDNSIHYDYGIDKSDVIVVKTGRIEEGEESDISYFDELMNLIENDLSDENNYKALCDIADMKSFADYFSVLIYTANEDALTTNKNNWRLWRSRSITDNEYQDGKWRFLLYDTEFSLGLYRDGQNTKKNSLKEACDSVWFGSLIKNNDFRELFCESMKETAERFKPDNSFEILDNLSALYGPMAADGYKRFGPDWLASGSREYLEGYFNNGISEIKKFLTDRYEYYPEMLESVFS